MIVQNQFKLKCLQTLYRLTPFNLKADGLLPTSDEKIIFSCVIPSRRPEELKNILEDLSLQDFPQEKIEVIAVNEVSKVISSLRNQGLASAHGEFILFLDDDTRIFQKDFLSKAYDLFKTYQADILLPYGQSLYGIMQSKQDFLDHFSFATRCCFYSRGLLERLGGFRNNLNSYSDIELSIRATLLSPVVIKSEKVSYFHPPLHFPTMQKPLAIGQSIFKLRQYYPLQVWLLIYVNALRFLPLALWPSRANRSWFKISLGVLLYPFKPQEYYHF